VRGKEVGEQETGGSALTLFEASYQKGLGKEDKFAADHLGISESNSDRKGPT